MAVQGGGRCGEGVDGGGPVMIQRGFPMPVQTVKYLCTQPGVYPEIAG